MLWNQPNTHVLITNQEMMIFSLLTSSESLSLMSTLMDIQELPGFVAQIECRLLIGLILLPISSCPHCEFSLNEHMFDNEHFQNFRYSLPCTMNVCHIDISLLGARSCKRSDTLFQKSLVLFLTWREYFYSQPTHFSSQPKK